MECHLVKEARLGEDFKVMSTEYHVENLFKY